MKATPLIMWLLGLPLLASSQSIAGDWQGALDIQGRPLRIVIHLQAADQGYAATMDSPDQGAKGIPVDRVSYRDQQLDLHIDAMNLQYEASYQPEQKALVGTFRQGGMSLPLTLTRGEPEAKTRPQDPLDFPYRVASVTFDNEDDSVTLAGTLTLPEGSPPKSVVVLITGSGPQNRNQELMDHRPFLVLSDYLTRQGIGVLRYDDRGVGASTGTFAGATSYDFAQDAAAAVRYLRQRPALAGVNVGLVGHSEGGMIAPIVATELAAVDFLVLMAGPGIPIDQLMLLQSEQITALQGVPDNIRTLNAQLLTRAYAYLKAHPDASTEDARAALVKLFQTEIDAFPAEVRAEMPNVESFIDQQVSGMITPWFRYFIRYEPAASLRQVNVPVLAINGSLDVQVPATENLAAIDEALQSGQRPPYAIKKLAGLNHLFQTAQTGAVSEYARIEETFSPDAMREIATWIKQW